jgi:hypothetical protein
MCTLLLKGASNKINLLQKLEITMKCLLQLHKCWLCTVTLISYTVVMLRSNTTYEIYAFGTCPHHYCSLGSTTVVLIQMIQMIRMIHMLSISMIRCDADPAVQVVMVQMTQSWFLQTNGDDPDDPDSRDPDDPMLGWGRSTRIQIMTPHDVVLCRNLLGATVVGQFSRWVHVVERTTRRQPVVAIAIIMSLLLYIYITSL